MDNYQELIERGKRYVANKGDNPLIPVIAELTGAVEALQARVSRLQDENEGLLLAGLESLADRMYRDPEIDAAIGDDPEDMYES